MACPCIKCELNNVLVIKFPHIMVVRVLLLINYRTSLFLYKNRKFHFWKCFQPPHGALAKRKLHMLILTSAILCTGQHDSSFVCFKQLNTQALFSSAQGIYMENSCNLLLMIINCVTSLICEDTVYFHWLLGEKGESDCLASPQGKAEVNILNAQATEKCKSHFEK